MGWTSCEEKARPLDQICALTIPFLVTSLARFAFHTGSFFYPYPVLSRLFLTLLENIPPFPANTLDIGNSEGCHRQSADPSLLSLPSPHTVQHTPPEVATAQAILGAKLPVWFARDFSATLNNKGLCLGEKK